MGATNHTTNYSLSQFEPTDKPAWLQDYNGDMTKIDAGINTAQLAADAAQLTANTADGKADSANGAITNTITPAISALQTASSNQGGAINTINSLIGNGNPTTTDQTIIGAINEINAEVGKNLTNQFGTVTSLSTGNNTITADGIIVIKGRLNQQYANIHVTVNSVELFSDSVYDNTSSVAFSFAWRVLKNDVVAISDSNTYQPTFSFYPYS